MKKLIGLLVAGLTISVFMVGCNKAPEGDNAQGATSNPVPSGSTTEPAKPGATDNSTTGNTGTPTKPTKPAGGPPGATGGATTGK